MGAFSWARSVARSRGRVCGRLFGASFWTVCCGPAPRAPVRPGRSRRPGSAPELPRRGAPEPEHRASGALFLEIEMRWTQLRHGGTSAEAHPQGATQNTTSQSSRYRARGTELAVQSSRYRTGTGARPDGRARGSSGRPSARGERRRAHRASDHPGARANGVRGRPSVLASRVTGAEWRGKPS